MSRWIKPLDVIFFLVACIILVSGLRVAHHPLGNRIFLLNQPASGWRFETPAGNQLYFTHYDALVFGNTTGILEQCCKGFYAAEFNLKQPQLQRILKNSEIGIFFNSAGGMTSVELDGKEIYSLPRPGHLDLGPVIPIDPDWLKNKESFHLKVNIDSKRHTYTGFARGFPMIGNLDDLLMHKERRKNYLQTLPIFSASIQLCFVILFGWLAFRLNLPNPLYRENFHFLLVSTLCLLCLAGLYRVIHPYLGSVIHLPLFHLLVLVEHRLLGTFAGTRKREIQLATILHWFVILISLASGFAGQVWVQALVLSVSRFSLIRPYIHLMKNRKTRLQTSIFMICSFFSVFYLSDATRMVSELFGFQYPIQYTERYTQVFLLLIPITFLVHELLQNMTTSARKKAFEEMARQVAHDIRSPLATLKTVSQDLSQISEESRLIADSAIHRIEDIVQDLHSNLKTNKEISIQSISDLIDPVVFEKRAQKAKNVEILFHNSLPNSFVKVNPHQFKRVISNLVDNSIEAIIDDGKVEIRLDRKYNFPYLEISIIDNGIGIPTEILPLLGTQGGTYRKEKGQGLGLFHAKTALSEWGGSLKIDSTPYRGTCVTIQIPVSK